MIISEPTRISNYSSTLIGLICCNLHIVEDSGVKDIHVSDHLLVYVTLNLKKAQPATNTFKFRNHNHINIANFQTDLENAPWNTVYDLDDVDAKVSFISDTILSVFKTHAPLKISVGKRKPYTAWMADNIKFMKTLRNQALNRFRQARLPQHWTYYKQLRNLTTSAIRAEEKAYLNFKLHNCTPKEKWNELKKLKVLNQKVNSIPDNLKKCRRIKLIFY